MCGIFGYIGKELNNKVILETLNRRGPDGSGVVVLPIQNSDKKINCTLLHTRLAIIDLSQEANQPMEDKQNGNVIIFNGEIYNYIELKNKLLNNGIKFQTNSDTEVILKGYSYWGENILNKLRGMFAFCIYNKEKSELLIARDKFGIKPLYYFQDGRDFCFSSNIQTILKSGIKKGFTLSVDSLKDFLTFGSALSPDTILENVKMLLPGHFIKYSNGFIKIQQYHSLSNEICEEYEQKENFNKKIRNAIFESVEKHLLADVPVGIFLSGGIDSSIIAGVAAQISNSKIHTYSIGFRKSKQFFDETAIASTTAKMIGSEHQNIYLDAEDLDTSLEEFIDAIDVPSIDGLNTFFISKAVGKYVKVILSGLGGDEMFAGYPVFSEVYNLMNAKRYERYLRFLPVKLLYRLGKQHLRYVGESLFDIAVSKRSLIGKEKSRSERLLKYFVEKKDPLQALSYFEISNYMTNILLRDTDSVSMFHSLEIRVPYVDEEVFRNAINMNAKYKIRKGVNKPLLVDSFKDLLIPETYALPKKGFNLPISDWLKEKNNFAPDKDFARVFNELNISEICGVKNYYSIPKDNKYNFLILYKWLEKNREFLSSMKEI